MTRRNTITLTILSLILAASLTANVLTFRKARGYYLQLHAIRLDPLGLGAFPNASPAMLPPAIVFFGDSRARQWPAPDGWKGATIVNRGIGNQTTAQVLGRFPQHVASLKPGLVVLQVGVNDLKTIPLFPSEKEKIVRNCQANIARLVRDAVESGSRVVVTTIMPLGKVPIERRPFWSDDVATAIKEVNATITAMGGERVSVFDTGQILAGPDGTVDPKYSRDLLHLQPEGYAALNRAIAPLLAP